MLKYIIFGILILILIFINLSAIEEISEATFNIESSEVNILHLTCFLIIIFEVVTILLVLVFKSVDIFYWIIEKSDDFDNWLKYRKDKNK